MELGPGEQRDLMTDRDVMRKFKDMRSFFFYSKLEEDLGWVYGISDDTHEWNNMVSRFMTYELPDKRLFPADARRAMSVCGLNFGYYPRVGESVITYVE
jgi:hypothetical protein